MRDSIVQSVKYVIFYCSLIHYRNKVYMYMYFLGLTYYATKLTSRNVYRIWGAPCTQSPSELKKKSLKNDPSPINIVWPALSLLNVDTYSRVRNRHKAATENAKRFLCIVLYISSKPICSAGSLQLLHVKRLLKVINLLLSSDKYELQHFSIFTFLLSRLYSEARHRGQRKCKRIMWSRN